jgi:hypothetical protein
MSPYQLRSLTKKGVVFYNCLLSHTFQHFSYTSSSACCFIEKLFEFLTYRHQQTRTHTNTLRDWRRIFDYIGKGKDKVQEWVTTIEILGATLEEACLKKGDFFSSDLHPIL